MIPNYSSINELPKKNLQHFNKKTGDYFDEADLINKVDYYYSNAICRASKTMSDCRNIKKEFSKTGTDE